MDFANYQAESRAFYNNNTVNEESKVFNIFLVEDDKDDRLLSLKLLKQSAHVNAVRVFRNGDELLSYFKKEGYYRGNLMRLMPKIILLDIHMPGTSGIDLLKKIKQKPETKDIPVIIITGDATDKMVKKARQLRADAFLTKPFNLKKFHEILRSDGA